MKRRQFLVGTRLAGRPRRGGAGDGRRGAAGGRRLAGRRLRPARRGKVLAVTHGGEPERVLWETDPEGNFLVAERATFRNRVSGIPEGSFEISDDGGGALGVADDRGGDGRGGRRRPSPARLSGPDGEIGYRLAFAASAAEPLRFTVGRRGRERGGQPHRAPARIERRRGVLRLRACSSPTSTRRATSCRSWCRSTASGAGGGS